MGRANKVGILTRIAATGAATALACGYPLTANAADSGQQPQARILGGEQTPEGAAPWAVALTDRAGNQICGGALVTPIKVVTAAHCMSDPAVGEPTRLRVIAGRGQLHGHGGSTGQVTKAWTHPGYQSFSAGNDIAVLTLNRPLSQRTLPMIGAGDQQPYRPGAVARVYGWGRTAENGDVSPDLRHVDVPVTTDDACHAAYSNYDPRSMFCAGYPEGGRDSCAGDSGGPIVEGDRLIGVVSYGTGCGRPNMPGVYTRLSTYTDEVRAQF